MIAKTKDAVTPADRFEQAGAAAEGQMAFYLRRAFGDAADVFVFNDLRLQVGDDSAQIDHLVLHPFGLFIVESKSISGAVEINAHGEWVRTWGGRRTGMPSPIQQAKRQAEFLRALLTKHKQTLRDTWVMGYLQGGFGGCPIDVCAAISDRGIIKRNGTNPPEVLKADLVCDRIRQEIDRHRRASGLLSRMDGDYGLWRLNPEELHRVRDFLLARHVPAPRPPRPAAVIEHRPAAPPRTPAVPEPVATPPVCKHCGSGALLGTHGKYGYYFKCSACQKNTPIDYACTACGQKGRIRKEGARFLRACAACSREEVIWVNTAQT